MPPAALCKRDSLGAFDRGRHERHGGGKAFRRIGCRRKVVPQRRLVLNDHAVPGPIVAIGTQGKAALPVVKRHVLLGKIQALHRVAPYSLPWTVVAPACSGSVKG